MDLDVNYPEVGATRRGDLPPGYRHLTRTAMRAVSERH